ncbi:Cell wall-associated polypeptide CWBP200 [Listeria ivanovii subsp. londoniensis]|nr:RHS repeat-associated core domain-containing protein [Listeria ivanovii]SDW91439.1 RHS repeat-associated core domain-containing protein [Listeria ivanovii]VEH44756.1 Cell wall-associated polypeptide CWBP200 [Listeria ivanovii subsp. londoniensis]
MKMNGKTLYYHYNAHGDVVALTEEASKVVAEYAYDAWGNVLKSEATTAEAKTNPYGYAGYTYDKEIEQYYLMARYYDPEQGVFTAVDPDPGDEDDPQTMNGYNYANNNPVKYVDPDGNWVWMAVGGAFGAYSGYKHAKKRGYKGWKMAASVAGGALLGAVGGGKIKAAGKAASKIFKYGRKLKFENVKIKGSRFNNYDINISQRQLKNRLLKSGWKQASKYNSKKTGVKGREINIRNKSKSRGPTAEYYRQSNTKHITKFRMRK